MVGKLMMGSECQTCLRQTFTAVPRRISLRKAKNCKTWTQKLLWRSLMTVFTLEVDGFATRCISWPQSLCSSMEAMESGHSDTLWDTFRYFHPLTFLSYLFVSFLSFFKYFFLLKFYVFLSLWFCFWMHVAVSVSRPSERKQMMKKTSKKHLLWTLWTQKKNIPKNIHLNIHISQWCPVVVLCAWSLLGCFVERFGAAVELQWPRQRHGRGAQPGGLKKRFETFQLLLDNTETHQLNCKSSKSSK